MLRYYLGLISQTIISLRIDNIELKPTPRDLTLDEMLKQMGSTRGDETLFTISDTMKEAERKHSEEFHKRVRDRAIANAKAWQAHQRDIMLG